MSRTHGNSISTSICAHPQEIEDDRTGDVICLDCCLVVGQIYVPQSTHLDYYHKVNKYLSKEEDTIEKTENNGKETNMIIRDNKNLTKVCDYSKFIQNVCANAHISGEIADYASHYCAELKTILNLKSLNLAIPAYAIYESLIRFECSRTMEEISNYSGVTTRSIVHVCNHPNIIHTHASNDPLHYVEKACIKINLSYPAVQIIRTLVSILSAPSPTSKVDVGMLRPNSLVALVIYLYCKEKNILGLERTAEKICCACSVTTTTLYRVIKVKIPEQYKNNITQLCEKS